MKTYVIITGVIFGLITLAHIWRIFAEGSPFTKDPFFGLLTVIQGRCAYGLGGR